MKTAYRIKCMLLVACLAAIFSAGALFSGFSVSARAESVNGVLQEENFDSGFKSGWEVEGAYDMRYEGDTRINSLYFNSAGVLTSEQEELLKDSTAVYLTRSLSGNIDLEFSVYLVSGAFRIIFGAANTESADPQAEVLTAGASSLVFGNETIAYGFDMIEKTATFRIIVSGDATAVAVRCEGEEKSGSLTLSSAKTEGYFGFAFSEENAAEGNLLDVSVTDGQASVYDTFTSEKTLAPFGKDASGYVWKPVIATGSVGARMLRMVTGNEMYNSGAAWPSEFAYTGYKLEGGVGAAYSVSYDLTLMRTGWIGYVFSPNDVQAGEYFINENTVLSGGRTFPAFVDGYLKTLEFGTGDGSEMTGSPIAYEYGRKMHVTMDMLQTAENETQLTVTFIYADDPEKTPHSLDYTVKQKIGGYVSFSHSAELIFSALEIRDGSGKLVGGDDFSTNNAYEKLCENWYIGLTKGEERQKNAVTVNDYGEYTGGALVANALTGNLRLRSLSSVPARESGVDSRENMFEATLIVNGNLSGGNFAFSFGDDGESPKGEIVFYADRIEAVKGSEKLSFASYAFPENADTEIRFTAKSSGEMQVRIGEETVFTANFGDETVFSGKYALSAVSDSSDFEIGFEYFVLEVRGVPERPILQISKPSFLPVGQEIDLAPVAAEDSLDGTDGLTLVITVEDSSGNAVSVEGTKTVLPKPDRYTVSYKLTNSYGLSAEDSFTARGIYRGTAENTADKIVDDFSSESDLWTVSGGSFGAAGLALSGGGFVRTNADFIYFLAYLRVSEAEGDFEIVFGECYDRENAFGICISADNKVTLRNLLAADGSTEAELAKDMKLGRETAYFRLMVIGSNVTLQGRTESDPLKYYDLAAFYFESDMPATYGKLGVYAEGGLKIESVAVYTLGGSPDISADDYDPEDEKTGRHVKPLKPSGKAWIIAGCVAGVVLAAGGVSAFVLVKKKKKAAAGKEKTRGEENKNDEK